MTTTRPYTAPGLYDIDGCIVNVRDADDYARLVRSITSIPAPRTVGVGRTNYSPDDRPRRTLAAARDRWVAQGTDPSWVGR